MALLVKALALCASLGGWGSLEPGVIDSASAVDTKTILMIVYATMGGFYIG